MEILVFKTSVRSEQHVNNLEPLLNAVSGSGAWSFDLEDRDSVLRIESENNISGDVIELVRKEGFVCEEMAD